MNNPSSWVRRIASRLFLGFFASIGAGCTPVVAPWEVLKAEFTVTPSVVNAGDSIIVTATISNPTNTPMRVHSPDGCVVLPRISFDGRSSWWKGTGLGCVSVISSFDVPAQGHLKREFVLVALLQEPHSPWDYTIPPAPGVYEIVMVMHVAEFENLSGEIVVEQ